MHQRLSPHPRYSSNDKLGNKSQSGILGNRKSIITRLLFDQPKEKNEQLNSSTSKRGLTPILRVNTNRSSSSGKNSKVLLKPILSKRTQADLPLLLGLRQQTQGTQWKIRNNLEANLEVEEIFYKQVRILQQFKKLASDIQ